MGSFNTHSIKGFQGFLAAVIGRLVRFAPYANSLLARCLGFFAYFLTDVTVKARYAAIGKLHTAMVDDGTKGADSVGVEHAFWKRAYDSRGFRAVQTGAFAVAVAHDEEPDGLGVRTEERPTLPTLPAVNAELLARISSGEFSVETPKIDMRPLGGGDSNVQVAPEAVAPVDVAPAVVEPVPEQVVVAPAVVVRPSVPVGQDGGPAFRPRRSATSGTQLGLAPIVLPSSTTRP